MSRARGWAVGIKAAPRSIPPDARPYYYVFLPFGLETTLIGVVAARSPGIPAWRAYCTSLADGLAVRL